MQQLTDKTLLNVLHKEYPHIVEKITNDVNASLPADKLTDLSKIVLIIESFKREKNLNEINFNNEDRKRGVVENRELLIAVILLFYAPHRLINIERRERNGIVDAFSKITGTSRRILSNTIVMVVVNFKVYDSFKSEVQRLYEIINEEHKFFK